MPSALERPLLMVLGMHRSGTSALTRLLSLAGAKLPQDLLKSDEFNPRGYFESARIVWANNVRLHSSGSAWDDPLLFPGPPWPPAEDQRWRALARTAFEEEFGASPWPLMKDPRLSVVLPAWRPVLTELCLQPRCVIAVRGPAAVAASLIRRDSFSVEKALLLWTSYMVAAVINTRDLPRLFVSYDALVADWRREAHRIEAALGFPSPVRDPLRASHIDEFLTPQLRHNSGGGDLARYGWVGTLAADVYAAIENALSEGAPEIGAVERAADVVAAKRLEFGAIISSISRDLDRARDQIVQLRDGDRTNGAAARADTA